MYDNTDEIIFASQVNGTKIRLMLVNRLSYFTVWFYVEHMSPLRARIIGTPTRLGQLIDLISQMKSEMVRKYLTKEQKS